MSWFSSMVDGLMGNADAGKLKSTLNYNMQDIISGQQQFGNQLGDYATQSMDYNSAQNQAMRNQFTGAAQDATATGALNAQRMASQQGMGGSGLLNQATRNQAYSNLMGANQQGQNAFLKNSQLGAGYLSQAGNILQGAGNQQSELNVSNANVDQNIARGRGQFMTGLLGFGAGALGHGGVGNYLSHLTGANQPQGPR
mgnify:CR=1 FL=1